MNAQYTISAFRAALPTIIDAVTAGSEVELTRHGKPVAVVLSKERFEQMQKARPSFTKLCEEHRAKWGADGLLDDEWVASLRDRSPGRDVQL